MEFCEGTFLRGKAIDKEEGGRWRATDIVTRCILLLDVVLRHGFFLLVVSRRAGDLLFGFSIDITSYHGRS